MLSCVEECNVQKLSHIIYGLLIFTSSSRNNILLIKLLNKNNLDIKCVGIVLCKLYLAASC